MVKPLKPESPDMELSAAVLRHFRVVFAAVRRHFKLVEKAVGLGGAQVWALSVIHQRAGLSLGELARRLDVHQSTASNLVKGLVGKGLVRMEKDTLDKRQLHLFVTEPALALLAKVPGPVEGLLPHALARMPQSSLKKLDAELAGLIGALNADESAGSIPLADL